MIFPLEEAPDVPSRVKHIPGALRGEMVPSPRRRGFPVAQVVKNLPAIQGTQKQGFNPWVGKVPWKSKWQPTPVFLPGKSCGQKSLPGYSPQTCKELHMAEHACTGRRQVWTQPQRVDSAFVSVWLSFPPLSVSGAGSKGPHLLARSISSLLNWSGPFPQVHGSVFQLLFHP